MSFDIDKFNATQFKDNTEDIAVPVMKDFFDDGEKPIWIVKALTGHELSKVNEAVKLNKDLGELLSGIASDSQADKVNAIKQLIGLSDNSPDDLVRRIATLKYGSVNPVCSQELAVKIAETFPTDFFNLTNKILMLTGDGKSFLKPKCSGTKQTSKTV